MGAGSERIQTFLLFRRSVPGGGCDEKTERANVKNLNGFSSHALLAFPDREHRLIFRFETAKKFCYSQVLSFYSNVTYMRAPHNVTQFLLYLAQGLDKLNAASRNSNTTTEAFISSPITFLKWKKWKNSSAWTEQFDLIPWWLCKLRNDKPIYVVANNSMPMVNHYEVFGFAELFISLRIELD